MSFNPADFEEDDGFDEEGEAALEEELNAAPPSKKPKPADPPRARSRLALAAAEVRGLACTSPVPSQPRPAILRRTSSCCLSCRAT